MLKKVSLIFFSLLTFLSCSEEKKDVNTDGFRWKETVEIKDIPDIPVKGYLNGTEVNFDYINFERWRGSNDNVINFSLVKPLQKCGYIDGFRGFSILRRGGDFTQGEWVKSDFKQKGNEEAYYISNGVRSDSEWNCALRIDEVTPKYVKGSVLIFFNDDKKSWVAGRFEAVVCNN
ncbi:MAG: hypothetical protein N2510_01135 [Ignavibacteria bacterium]|nr:hypothetical protein [Ignavibacteria bacterium]